MKEEVRSKTKKKIATETEESLIERGRQEVFSVVGGKNSERHYLC